MILEKPAERRREERWRVCFGARRLDARPHAQALTVIDLSASGLLIKVDQILPVGTCMIVELPNSVSKICRTVWNSGNYHGAQFSEPLSTAELESLLSPPPTIWPLTLELDEATDLGSLPQEEPDHDADDNSEPLSQTASAWLIAGATAILWALLGFGAWAAAA
ncbi:PilZ domain-containing protein [Erythrobacter sp. sf7]|uniref:PilZ domain-containing protein n=1 Tax=Erythrobacter fulvus TaxID=2987523 RepID=A0ABT5JMF4_9SPHN|nr:PilZ domain-containing protein [Erythrobacter fulvus]MDC8753938.1 PilZ domain-containing protein [Erythrobacter fulvus]